MLLDRGAALAVAQQMREMPHGCDGAPGQCKGHHQRANKVVGHVADLQPVADLDDQALVSSGECEECQAIEAPRIVEAIAWRLPALCSIPVASCYPLEPEVTPHR
jgi:hypothetical protein